MISFEDFCASIVSDFSLDQLRDAFKVNVENYRVKRKIFLKTEAQKMAYLLSRMPATYSVLKNILSSVKPLLLEKKFDSVLDFGSGIGSSFFALKDIYPSLQDFLFIEKDRDLRIFGKRFLPKIEGINFQWNDNLLPNQIGKDILLLSYVINELNFSCLEKIITTWIEDSKAKVLIIVEPGTTYGFEKILFVRELLVKNKINLVAPCSHINPCPLNKEKKWCHFSQRVQRSEMHRLVKLAKKGYEDEKYSYLIATKQDFNPYQARVIDRPLKRSGHITFSLCSNFGLKKEIVSKKDFTLYSKAKKMKWGDIWNYF
jgi:ribosomal protein RSM22 (predicted rRNA methylase)